MSEKQLTASITSSAIEQSQSGARARSRATTAASARTTPGGIDLASLIVIIVVLLAIGVTAFFVYRGSSLKSQLTQARNDALKERTQLQLQINTAAAKVRESAGQMDQLRSQLDLAKTEAASAKASAAKASSQVEALQAQVTQARRQAALMTANAEKALAELAKLKAQLEPQDQEAAPAAGQSVHGDPPSAAPLAASGLKPMPLVVSFQEAPMLDRNALALKNTSAASLSLTIRFSNRNESKNVQVKLEPGGVKELGWLGDWVLASGDKVEIKSAGYAPIVKMAP